MGLREVLEYLVLLQLSGRSNAVHALHDYFDGGNGYGGVAEIARRYGLGKQQLRSYVQRILDKVEGLDRVRKARIYVKHVAPLVLALVKPIIELDTDRARCRLCGETLYSDNLVVALHIVNKHRDVLEHEVEKIVTVLRMCCRKGIAFPR